MSMKEAEFLIVAQHAAVPLVIKSIHSDRAIISSLIFALTRTQFRLAQVLVKNVEGGLAAALA